PASGSEITPRVPVIRVDFASFWYERTPPPPPCDDAGPRRLDGSKKRVLAAVSELLLRHPTDFPLPPPLDIVVRATPREALEGIVGVVAESTSYGGSKLVGDTVYIDVHRSVLVGWHALNDAELRALLGHELVHAYQFAAGPYPGNGPELWRRELAAYTWELEHLEPAVRPWFREESATSVALYRDLVRNPE